MTQLTYPHGQRCISLPLLTSHLLVSAPQDRNKASTSSGVLVRSAEIYPSNMRTNGRIGIKHEKISVAGDRHLNAKNGALKNAPMPKKVTANTLAKERSCSSKIARPSLVSTVSRRISLAKSSSK